MQQQTNLPATIDTQKFGDLIKLPDILKKNQELKSKAAIRVKEVLALIPPDWKNFDIVKGDEIDTTLAEVQAKLTDAKKVCNERRSPYTQLLTQITSLFTAEENELTDFKESISGPRNAWQREKSRQQQERLAAENRAIAKKQEAVELAGQIELGIKQRAQALINTQISKFNERFNSKSIEELPAYGEKLKTWIPVLSADDAVAICKNGEYNARFHLPDEYALLYDNVKSVNEPHVVMSYQVALIAERNRLVELIPSRIAELQRAAQDAQAKADMDARLAREAAEREQAASIQKQQAEEAAKVQAEVKKEEVIFDYASTAQPAIQISKGTVQKLAYRPTTHAELLKLLQFWLTSEFTKLSFEEANKRLSWVRTAANESLNNGITIEGCPFEEEFSTRGRRPRRKEDSQ